MRCQGKTGLFFSPVQTLPDSGNNSSESYVENSEALGTLWAPRQGAGAGGGLPRGASPTPEGPALDSEPVACSGARTLAGSPLSRRLGHGAGGAHPAWRGGSRTQPSPAASGPSPVRAWPRGAQECACSYARLCALGCAAVRCCGGWRCHEHQLSKQERNGAKRGGKENPKRCQCLASPHSW